MELITISDIAGRAPDGRDGSLSFAAPGSVPLTENEYRDYLDNLLSGNRQACMDVVQRLLDEKVGVRAIYLDLFQRSLYDVGSMWERNEISVAVEPLATAVTERLMSLVYPVLFRGERVNKKAVVACVANEYHQIGGRMVADIFELNGWDSYFLGANTPTSSLIDMISRTEPDIVGLSLAVCRLPPFSWISRRRSIWGRRCPLPNHGSSP